MPDHDRMIYAGGLAHGSLLRIRQLLRERNHERASFAVQEGIDAIERILYEPPPERKESAGGRAGD